MARTKSAARSPATDPPAARKEPWPEQIASFVGFFIYLLILKTFFLPLFIIPTGSMAETLYGAHALQTCPNCGVEYPIGWNVPGPPGRPRVVQCPNCRWQLADREALGTVNPPPGTPGLRLEPPPRSAAGDRIFVHGWLFDRPFKTVPMLGPARWDVVVFKVPTDGETNYIKRLLGLPGEKIELINGDLFVNDRLEAKSADAQRALWFPYYDHDHTPRAASRAADYHPRWVALENEDAWQGVETRVLAFADTGGQVGTLQFASDPDEPRAPGVIHDFYAYNVTGHQQPRYHAVNDVRLSAEIELTRRGPGSFVELSLKRFADTFCARLSGTGELTLLHSRGPGPRDTWATAGGVDTVRPLRLALSHVDGRVVVEVDGRPLLTSTPAQYTITPGVASRESTYGESPTLQVRAGDVELTLRHLLIERDVYYTSDVGHGHYGTAGHAVTLSDNQYFLVGDNSPNSQDARYAFAKPWDDPTGPHLKDRPDFQLGTVPGDQLIGRAFFVYWPGFLPLTSHGPNLLPDLGRARWIR